MSRTEDNFLGRWSRRKIAADNSAPASPVETEAPESLDDLSDEEVLEKLGLPDPDTLNEGDDFSQFMKAAVPDRLRNRALRKLWASNPILANLDGLVEYGEDYTDAAMVPEVLNTAYKIGRGFIDDLVEDDDESGAETDLADAEEEVETEDIDLDQDVTELSVETTEELAASIESEQLAEFEEPQKSVPRPRMNFVKTA